MMQHDWQRELEQLDGIDTETECVTICVGDEIAKLRAALAEPEQSEPVAWLIRVGDAPHWSYCETEADADFYGKQSCLRYEKKPLFAHPPRRGPL